MLVTISKPSTFASTIKKLLGFKIWLLENQQSDHCFPTWETWKGIVSVRSQATVSAR